MFDFMKKEAREDRKARRAERKEQKQLEKDQKASEKRNAKYKANLVACFGEDTTRQDQAIRTLMRAAASDEHISEEDARSFVFELIVDAPNKHVVRVENAFRARELGEEDLVPMKHKSFFSFNYHLGKFCAHHKIGKLSENPCNTEWWLGENVWRNDETWEEHAERIGLYDGVLEPTLEVEPEVEKAEAEPKAPVVLTEPEVETAEAETEVEDILINLPEFPQPKGEEDGAESNGEEQDVQADPPGPAEAGEVEKAAEEPAAADDESDGDTTEAGGDAEGDVGTSADEVPEGLQPGEGSADEAPAVEVPSEDGEGVHNPVGGVNPLNELTNKELRQMIKDLGGSASGCKNKQLLVERVMELEDNRG